MKSTEVPYYSPMEKVVSAALTQCLNTLDEYSPLLTQPLGRQELTRNDPLAFALIYLRHHLDTDGEITLSEFHEALISYGTTWIDTTKQLKGNRDIWVAPRECGKSTWLFLILPMWAAAHGHVKFISAFADSATQAENHLLTFRRELDSNELLRADYPDLCTPASRGKRATTISDNKAQISQVSGFTFTARGIDTAVAGQKMGNTRPDLILLDDIEPGESNYSAHLVNKRLTTLADVILPLNAFARVVLVGTATMPGSIIHQAVMHFLGHEQESPWIEAEAFRCHYFPALIEQDDGSFRSLWPQKWPVEEMLKMANSRSFKKNFQNMPVDLDGSYWTPEMLSRLGEPADTASYTRTILSVDPAVTSKGKSDYTGMAVVSAASDGNYYVRWAGHGRYSPAQLRQRTIGVLEQFEDCTEILIETNQGGDLWRGVFGNLPCRYRTIHQRLSKEVRASKVLLGYERARIFHTQPMPALEAEMLSFPAAAHDDLVDAVVSGLLYLVSGRNQGPRFSYDSYL